MPVDYYASSSSTILFICTSPTKRDQSSLRGGCRQIIINNDLKTPLREYQRSRYRIAWCASCYPCSGKLTTICKTVPAAQINRITVMWPTKSSTQSSNNFIACLQQATLALALGTHVFAFVLQTAYAVPQATFINKSSIWGELVAYLFKIYHYHLDIDL